MRSAHYWAQNSQHMLKWGKTCGRCNFQLDWHCAAFAIGDFCFSCQMETSVIHASAGHKVRLEEPGRVTGERPERKSLRERTVSSKRRQWNETNVADGFIYSIMVMLVSWACFSVQLVMRPTMPWLGIYLLCFIIDGNLSLLVLPIYYFFDFLFCFWFICRDFFLQIYLFSEFYVAWFLRLCVFMLFYHVHSFYIALLYTLWQTSNLTW